MRPARSVEGNARLTGLTAAVLFLLFAAEGVTVLRVRQLLTPHVVIGMVMVPVVVVKMGSTLWRFARYYGGDPEYRRKGPPPVFLRLLGPFVVVLTVAVLGTGIALLFVPTADRSQWLFLHKATFVLWLGAMAVHVLFHLLETANLTWNDLSRRTRRQVRGAGARQWLLVSALVLGILLAILVTPHASGWHQVPIGANAGSPNILVHAPAGALHH
jgi:hypothetical protein